MIIPFRPKFLSHYFESVDVALLHHSLPMAVAQFKWEVGSAVTWDSQHGGDGQIIIHEYGYWPAWGGDVPAFVAEIRPWLEEQNIPAAWFALQNVGDYISPWHDTSLVEDGALTAIGQAYR